MSNTIKIEGEVVIINELPENIQHQVALFNYIASELMEAKKKLGMVELSKVEASRQITASYRAYKESQKASNEEVEDQS